MNDKKILDEELSKWTGVHSLSVSQFEEKLASHSGMGKGPAMTVKDWIIQHRNDLQYGVVKYSSEIRTTKTGDEGHRLDWALIKPTIIQGERSLGLNTLPSENGLKGKFNFHGKTHVHAFADDSLLKEGGKSLYFKVGYTSGLTEGVYNHLEAGVKMKSPPNSDYPNCGHSLITKKHTIILTEKEDLRVFSKKGDSGSWVITQEGALMGLSRPSMNYHNIAR